ncbi:MAG: hypothetical protein HOP07_03830 [Bacteriovoracaceae bacterium]|nr:hypothetical protein [Bacteriovoracaceae bacterium]
MLLLRLQQWMSLLLVSFFRREGLFMANLEQWKTDLTNGLKSAAGSA